MDIKIKSNFRFTVAAIEYTPGGELYITLESDSGDRVKQYEYTASLGDGAAVSKPVVSLLEYARGYYAASGVKEKTRDCYRLMCRHLEAYGDKAMDEVTTEYLQGFVSHLQGHGLQVGTVRLYFQKLTCVLHEAYRDGLFDDRVLQRVRLPRRERRKRSFLTEAELGRLSRTPLGGDSGNIQDMFMFSCLTGLRFGDAPYSFNVTTDIKTGLFEESMLIKASVGQDYEDIYFYHSDHLGSASWITDGLGTPVQHLQYLPFGEPFVDQRAAGSTYNERFTFTGKERDRETGFSYFGARYYDSDLSGLFLSVDPMADKYPSISPYAYCAWNPVKLVDPDGREVADFYNLKGEWIGTDGIEDGRIFLVTNESDVSMILTNGENCGIQTTKVSDVKSAIELPSVKLREAMLSTLIENDNSNPYREYGGLVIGETNPIIAWAKPGPEFQYGELAHINPFDLQDRDILIQYSDDCAQKWRFHSHPSGIRWKGNNYSQIIQVPDDYDVANMNISKPTSGYAFQFGMRSRVVNIYNNKGPQASISFVLFNNIGR